MISAADIYFNNFTIDARINSDLIAAQSQFGNCEYITKIQEYAADICAHQRKGIANQYAAANNAAACVNRCLGACGIEIAYRKQILVLAHAYKLNLDINQIDLSEALHAAEILRSSGMKAVRNDRMSQIVSTWYIGITENEPPSVPKTNSICQGHISGRQSEWRKKKK